ncbi:hypothetical protein CICLE_v10021753mg [Citrus x clementina]|uniref:Protein kinase domain-containing protein n=1 Tax=Citrus clementina TaxID=85681 RepID=V4T6X0_CITCL|nr:hypothetical protein CICLE_v10021753mg [Citrus x clementina]
MISIKKIVGPSMDAAALIEEDSMLLNKKMRQIQSEMLLNKKMRQIQSEINTVGQIRHRNLHPLLAHVTRPDCHLLVRELDWLARHRIALGLACGLEYLHMHHCPRIIHRDLNPVNVLLDDDMEARISGFGFARAIPDAHTHITTSNVVGTVEYIAPEYLQMLTRTEKCDIYFGVLLAGLVMGKLPSDKFFQHTNEMSFVKWMRNVMASENSKRAIDSKLVGNGCEEQMLLVLKIACFCTLEDPNERPNSKDVRRMLSQIQH